MLVLPYVCICHIGVTTTITDIHYDYHLLPSLPLLIFQLGMFLLGKYEEGRHYPFIRYLLLIVPKDCSRLSKSASYLWGNSNDLTCNHFTLKGPHSSCWYLSLSLSACSSSGRARHSPRKSPHHIRYLHLYIGIKRRERGGKREQGEDMDSGVMSVVPLLWW